MMYIAESKNLKMSPRKIRLVVEGVKMLTIERALSTLSVAPQRAALPIRKALQSAVANAVHNGKVNKEELFISEMFVNEGISLKRYHYAGRGRIRPYKKRTSHLKVILGLKEVKALSAPKVEEIKTAEKSVIKKGGAEERGKKNAEPRKSA